MLIFALGGAARRLFDDLDAEERQHGVDLPDGFDIKRSVVLLSHAMDEGYTRHLPRLPAGA